MMRDLSTAQSQALSIGSPSLLGTIAATTAKSNIDTAVPFNSTGSALSGKLLFLQADVACYVTVGAASTAAVGVLIGASERFYLWLKSTDLYVSILPVSGTANVKCFELT